MGELYLYVYLYCCVNSEYRLSLCRELGDLVYDYCNVQPCQTRHCLQLAQRRLPQRRFTPARHGLHVRLGDVETALEYAEQQRCGATQLAQVDCDDAELFCTTRSEPESKVSL